MSERDREREAAKKEPILIFCLNIGEQVKEFWDMDGYEVWQDILILLTFIVGLHTINYLLLRRSAAKSE